MGLFYIRVNVKALVTVTRGLRSPDTQQVISDIGRIFQQLAFEQNLIKRAKIQAELCVVCGKTAAVWERQLC